MYSDGTKDSEITSVNPDPMSELNISYPQYSFVAALYVCVCVGARIIALIFCLKSTELPESTGTRVRVNVQSKIRQVF